MEKLKRLSLVLSTPIKLWEVAEIISRGASERKYALPFRVSNTAGACPRLVNPREVSSNRI